MHTLGLSTTYFLLPWNLGWLYNPHSGGGSPRVSSSWQPEECWRLNARIPPPLPRSPKGFGVSTVEAEKPQGTLCRAAQGECSSFLFCMGPVGSREGHAAQPKGFPPTCNPDRQIRFRDGRCAWWQNSVLLTYVSAECKLGHHGINNR